ncbi:hypothetical protein J2S70_000631 [Trueperella bonasi]|uniref:SPW repeat-containing protein n=1 Tax=Trueperella bonasi TaxID=312286 RepID=A0ABT9NF83_9ACTO|nr:hypothetical protein [Trueperella bonasi]MDP9806049.1 hypothetical protein [Trueperella bonasi]
MRVFPVFVAFAAGILSGVLGVVVYPGPLDKPVVGLLVATAIVASGAWAMWEWKKAATWGSYALATFVTTIVLMYFPPGDDHLAAVDHGFTNAWVVLSAVSIVTPPLISGRTSHKRGAHR